MPHQLAWRLLALVWPLDYIQNVTVQASNPG